MWVNWRGVGGWGGAKRPPWLDLCWDLPDFCLCDNALDGGGGRGEVLLPSLGQSVRSGVFLRLFGC